MHGVPELIVTDCGSAYRSEAFQRVCADLGIPHQKTIAGVPELRGRVERMFRTISYDLLPHLTGRTFSDVVSKGDSNPADRATLTTEDLAFAIVRWVVDIYHNKPHQGLGGETPLECWRRLTEIHPVLPPPDRDTSRMVFGQMLHRVLDKRGLRVLGVYYHSPELAHWFLESRERNLEIRWLPSDLGKISVRLGGTRWITVPAVMDGLDNVSAQTWSAAVREIKAADPGRKAYREDVALKALAAIINRTEGSKAAAGLLVDTWSPERVIREEEKLFIGFDITKKRETRPRGNDGGVGRSIATLCDLDTPDRIAPARAPTTTAPRERGGKFKLED